MTNEIELPVDDPERLEELRTEHPRRWAFGMLRAVQSLDADLESLGESRAAMVEEYKEAREGFVKRHEDLRESLLEYVKAEGGPVRLGDVTINMSLTKMALTVTDGDAFMAVLNIEELDEVTKRTLVAAPAKELATARLEATGEVMPGVEVVEAHNNLTIRGGKK